MEIQEHGPALNPAMVSKSIGRPFSLPTGLHASLDQRSFFPVTKSRKGRERERSGGGKNLRRFFFTFRCSEGRPGGICILLWKRMFQEELGRGVI